MAKSKAPADVIPIKPTRRVIIDLLHLGTKVSRIHAIGEEDCDDALRRLDIISEKLGRKISFTAFLATCQASMIKNHPIMQAYRKGNNIILFDDVDTAVVVERDFNGKKVPTSYIVRAAQTKNVVEISDEIREAQESKTNSAATSTKKVKQSKAVLVSRLPGFIRRWVLSYMMRNPYFKKKLFGTVGLSSIGMFTMGNGSAVPTTVHSSTIIVGGISKRAWVVDDEIKIRKVLSAVISMDHDLTDGGPAARAIAEFRNNIKNCHGLDEIEKELGIA